MNVIGLGKAGCAIADKFGEHAQYKTYKIDTELEGKRAYKIKSQASPEAYESNFASMKTFFRGIKGKSLLIIGGSGHISAISLRLIQQLRDKCELDILYIKPDTFLLSESKKMHEKVTYNVLQQYTRSGAIGLMYLMSNPTLESILGEVPIMGYYEKLNELIVSTMHMINVYRNTAPIMGGVPNFNKDSTKKICTVGIFDIKENQEKLFFPLDTVRERGYIYSISKDRLQTESGLHKQITSQMKEKISDENVNVSFGVFPTEYNADYGYVLCYSPNIQS